MFTKPAPIEAGGPSQNASAEELLIAYSVIRKVREFFKV
jgi:hypothetical protein